MKKRFEEEEGEEGEHARRRIERRAMASLTLWSDWANKSRTWTILALALSARSSGSPHTARSAFEIGSRRPSCVRMRQKSLRGVGPCERGTESAPVRTSNVQRRDETHVHLEDPADAVDGHPDEVLALLVCSVESISTCVRREERERERRTVLAQHLDERAQALARDEHLQLRASGRARVSFLLLALNDE